MYTETRVTRVTVHRNGALVLRAGQAGPGPVEVSGLPLTLSSESLRVRPARGRIRDLREACSIERVGDSAPQAEEVRALARLDLAMQALDDRLAAVQRRIALFGQIEPIEPAGDKALHLPDPALLVELNDFAEARLEALEQQLAALEQERVDLELERARRRRQAEGDRTPPRFHRGVRFELADCDGETDFELEYFVAAARWVPDYTLDLDGGRGRLRLDALVAQATGEDWSGAEVRVATADLTRETRAPALRSWRIGTAQAPPQPAWRPLPADLPSLFTGYDTAGGRRQSPRGPEPAKPKARDLIAAAIAEEVEPALALGAPPEVARSLPPGGPPRPSAPPPPPMAMPAAPARAEAFAAPVMAPAAKRSGGLGFGGGGGGPTFDVVGGQVRPPDDQGPGRRLRHAWLRLAGPDEEGRGRLYPVDPVTHLWSLVEDHGVADVDSLRRAVDAIREAARRLLQSPTPPGTRALPADGFHHTFTADGRHDVPGDGHWHRVPAQQAEAPAETEYRAVPRESGEVFRYCRLRLGGGTPYPAGPLHVYIDGGFRVTATLDGTGGGQALELNLGQEAAIRVMDRIAHVRQQDKGLMSQTTQVEHAVSLRVRSALQTPARIVLFDRLPVPAQEQTDVAVELVHSEPAAERTNRGPRDEHLEGGLRWSLQVPAGGTVDLRYTYQIAFPAKMEIAGGNRRE